MGTAGDKGRTKGTAAMTSATGAMGEPCANGGRIDVSVVVPCYNTERFLDQALSSIEANDRCSLEVIVLNDGSTDGSLAIMRAHEAADARIRVIDKANQGYGATVNRGFAEARGTYLAIVEPDDWVEPHMYDDLVDYARTFSPGLDPATAPDVVKTPYWRIWMPETPKERRYNCSYRYRIAQGLAQPFTLHDEPRLVMHHPSIWSALYRRGFIEESGIRFHELPGAGWVDNPFLFDTLCRARRIVYLDTPYYCYREDLPGSSSARRVASLSFERWNDMADVVEGLGVTDQGILRALCVIGFRYIGASLGEGALESPELTEMIRAICRRMDPEAVRGCANVSPKMKAFVLEMAGRSTDGLSPWPYRRALVDEFFYSARNNGLGFALSRLGIFLRRHAAEHGLADPTTTRSASI